MPQEALYRPYKTHRDTEEHKTHGTPDPSPKKTLLSSTVVKRMQQLCAAVTARYHRLHAKLVMKQIANALAKSSF